MMINERSDKLRTPVGVVGDSKPPKGCVAGHGREVHIVLILKYLIQPVRPSYFLEDASAGRKSDRFGETD